MKVAWQIQDATGKVVATAQSTPETVPAGGTLTFAGQALLSDPALWSIETPTLYRATAMVQADNAVLDGDTTSFGIRTVRFDANKGFLLNGKPVKI